MDTSGHLVRGTGAGPGAGRGGGVGAGPGAGGTTKSQEHGGIIIIPAGKGKFARCFKLIEHFKYYSYVDHFEL